MAIVLPLTIVLAMLPGANSPEHARTMSLVMAFIVYGGSFAVQALTRPIYGIALILFYYDQRIRQEAFDIEWMMLRAGLVVPSPAQPGAESGQQAVPVAPNLPEEQTAPVVVAPEPAGPASEPAPESSVGENPNQPAEAAKTELGEPA
jgi:hypothetical protein